MSDPHRLTLASSVLILFACAGTVQKNTASLALAPFEQMPPKVRTAPQEVRDAYRFAAANPEVLRKIPCYCGCEDLGHRDNYACYVEEVRPDGSVAFSEHGFG